MANFAGAICRKYAVELTGIMQYVANQLKAGKRSVHTHTHMHARMHAQHTHTHTPLFIGKDGKGTGCGVLSHTGI